VVLRRDSAATGRKDSSAVPAWRRFSTDSLDSLRRNSWDPSNRRGSSGSSAGCEDPIWEETRVSRVAAVRTLSVYLPTDYDHRQIKMVGVREIVALGP
jgi:hypothetical protein